MERLMIQVPEKRSKLIKSLLKELGAIVESDPFELAFKINKSVKPEAAEITMDEIVDEVKAYRSGK